MTTALQSPGPRRVRVWPVGLLAAPAAVAIWSGWVGLGELAGFGTVRPLPGIVDDFTINTAITLPIGMETYAAFALRAWLTPGVPDRARRFARASAIGALVLGALGQVAYHLMAAAGVTAAPWPITALVACLPVGVLGLGAALAHLLHTPNETGQPVEGEDRECRTTVVPASRTVAVTESTVPGLADRPAEDRTPAVPDRRTTAVPDSRTTGPRRPVRPVRPALPAGGPDVADLLPTGRSVADQLAHEDRALSRATLLAGLRAAGCTCSTERASALLTALRAERTDTGRPARAA